MGKSRDQMVAELEDFCSTIASCISLHEQSKGCPLFKFMEHKSECCDFETLDDDDLNSVYNIMLVAKDMIDVRHVANEEYVEPNDKPDMVQHPPHYNQGDIECIDAIKSAVIGKTGIEAVCVANVIKYLWRYETKNRLEDVKKAQFYLKRLVEELEYKNK